MKWILFTIMIILIAYLVIVPPLSGDCSGKIRVWGFHNPIYNVGCGR